MVVERLDQLGEVGKRVRQAINLVDNDHIHPALPHLGEQKLQGWTLERGAREPTVFIGLRQKPPALMGLTLDVSLIGLTLAPEAFHDGLIIQQTQHPHCLVVNSSTRNLSVRWVAAC
jgi:hypothetical protein